MMDEIFDRQYQSGRAELHAGFDRLVVRISRGLGNVFGALRRIQFDAPWADRGRDARRTGQVAQK